MSNNNRKDPPITPHNQRYPQPDQPISHPRSNNQYHNTPHPFYQQGQYRYPYQQRPYPPANSKQAQEMSRHQQTYNQQVHYNNYYYPQYMPPYPQYPPPPSSQSPYPNNYQQYRPHPPNSYNNYSPNTNTPKQMKIQQVQPQNKNYSPRDNKKSYQKEQLAPHYPKNEKRPYNNDTPRKRDQRQQQNSSHQNNNENDSREFCSSSNQQSQQEQVIYRRKTIIKKKDPVLDSKQQIRKWVEARRRNYPKRTLTSQQVQVKVDQSEISILQKKIRKKILLINADPRSMMKKQKDIDILRRFILYSRKNKKSNLPVKYNTPKAITNTPVKEEQQQVSLSKVVIQQPEIEIVNNSQNQLPQQQNEQLVVQMPIKSQPKKVIAQQPFAYRNELSVDVIIKHLQMKQAEDTKTLQNLMDYKSNSFYYRYQHQTLQTNLLLQNIFNQTSYILQAIRYIVKNNFFDQKLPQEPQK